QTRTVLQPASHKGLFYKQEEWQKYKERTSATRRPQVRAAARVTVNSNTKNTGVYTRKPVIAGPGQIVRRVRPAASAI
ncbi:MAG TPA: hypothetical protein VEH58_01585, partial [Dehalococcoidales bacterium]|nr:hypothetical protein [Dehalococcoidales bacterium]